MRFHLAAALACAVSAAQARILEFNSTVSHMDPLVQFTPAVDGEPDMTWGIRYENINHSDWFPGKVGRGGPSYHQTSLVGASVALSWVGTGVYFWGNVTNFGTVNIIIDGASSRGTPTDSLVASVSGLEYGLHRATIVLDGGNITIYNVTVTTGLETTAPTIGKVPTQDQMGSVGGAANNLFRTSWYNNSEIRSWEPMDSTWEGDKFIRIRAGIEPGEPPANVTYNLPANTTYFEIYGSVNWDHGRYGVRLSPPAPALPDGYFEASAYNGWAVPRTLMWQGPVDPTVQYQMTYVALASNEEDYFWKSPHRNQDFYKVTTYSALYDGDDAVIDDMTKTNTSVVAGPSGSPQPADANKPKQTNVGAIAGGVIGGVLAFVLLAALVYLLYRRRRDKNKEASERPQVDINEDDRGSLLRYNVTPYAGMSQPQASPGLSKAFSAVAPADSPGLSDVSPPSFGFPLPPDAADSALKASILMAAATGYNVRPADSPPRSVVRQERDAGRVVAVPPVYDPQWAEEP